MKKTREARKGCSRPLNKAHNKARRILHVKASNREIRYVARTHEVKRNISICVGTCIVFNGPKESLYFTERLVGTLNKASVSYHIGGWGGWMCKIT